MSSPEGSRRRYVQPRWPEDEPFILEMLGAGGGHVLGPFTADRWDPQPDGSMYYSDGYTHPITLRVRSREPPDPESGGPLILHANDGSMGDMDYAVWTRASWAKGHPGEGWLGDWEGFGGYWTEGHWKR